MSDYEFIDYGIFTEGVSLINTLNSNVQTGQDTVSNCGTRIKDESIFMGPICDSCVEGFLSADTRLTTMASNFTTIADYLVETSSTYKEGDDSSVKKILRLQDGKVIATTSRGVVTGNVNQDAIYSYLANLGFNDAAISGILANIKHESGLDPNALGDGGTSYGLCQWHASRWDELNAYCSQNGMNASSVDGQLSFMVWELQTKYPSLYQQMLSVPNTADGAYQAAYQWTVQFERPANMDAAGQTRGYSAINDYWPTYGNQTS